MPLNSALARVEALKERLIGQEGSFSFRRLERDKSYIK
jgi:hypothetical protein